MNTQSKSSEDKYQNFQCKICLDVATEPVVTPCGHLYCWDCLYNWSKTKGNPVKCPLCSSMVDINKCTTIFTGENSSRGNIPKRPENPRQEPPPQQRQQGWNNIFQNTQFSFGLGLPFMFFSNFNLNNNNNQGGQQNSRIGLIIFIVMILVQILPSLTYSYSHSSSRVTRNNMHRHYNNYDSSIDDDYDADFSTLFLIAGLIGFSVAANYAVKIFQRNQRQ